MVAGAQAQSVLQPCLSGERGGQSVKGAPEPRADRAAVEHGEDAGEAFTLDTA